MKRTQIYLTEKQHEQLNKVSENNDIKISELIRRIIDEWIDRQNK
ncbi:MAG TPA: ribbon-helix-helix protein, CopG family [Pseudoneobacillus sp.]|nr:ribbon-helix-helix protein, CopG family [Pseudoneobacillus sp.]